FVDLNWVPIVEDWSVTPHKLVGVGITIPSLTRALQKLHKGRLLPFGPYWKSFVENDKRCILQIPFGLLTVK
ncbi:MAG: hypothetical protein ACFN4R_07760, partial [Streptococcus gordonii]